MCLQNVEINHRKLYSPLIPRGRAVKYGQALRIFFFIFFYVFYVFYVFALHTCVRIGLHGARVRVCGRGCVHGQKHAKNVLINTHLGISGQTCTNGNSYESLHQWTNVHKC